MMDPLSYFSFQPFLHDWCNKGCGNCYPVCGMMHIKEPLLLIGKSSSCLFIFVLFFLYFNNCMHFCCGCVLLFLVVFVFFNNCIMCIY